MRASRFWRARDTVFRLLRLFGVPDPLPVPTSEELRIEMTALGDRYQLFRASHAMNDFERNTIRTMAGSLAVRESFDVIVDARSRTRDQLAVTLDSLHAQLYPYWRAYICGASAEPVDSHVTYGWSIGALPASGTFVAPLQAGDALESDALLSLALALANGADVAYTDSDAYDEHGIPRDPHFKPDWSPETALTRDYVGRLCAFRTSVLEAAGGLDTTMRVALWYDALLRVTERTERIVHLAKVLVHCTTSETGDSSQDRANAVAAALARRGERATARAVGPYVDVRFDAPDTDRVSIIIPTRDHAQLLGPCLSSIFERTDRENFEVIVVDNGSKDPATADLFDAWHAREPRRFRVLRDDGDFNFSRLNNRAIETAEGAFVVLLNNDTQVISADWMTAMLGQARRPSIGAVGALLLYADGTIQHAGVMLGGVLGLAGHAFRLLNPEEAHDRGALDFDTNYLAVTGACLMVERRKFDQVGGLDEELAVAYNDIDLCAKLRHAGYRNVIVPRARLFHFESKSRGADDTAAKRERGFRESETFRHRWPEWSLRDPYYNPNLTLHAEDFSCQP